MIDKNILKRYNVLNKQKGGVIQEMFIHEAVNKAIQTGGVIYRESVRKPESDIYALIRPTNSYEACQIIICKYGKKERSARSWSPTADDLAADDWNCSRNEF